MAVNVMSCRLIRDQSRRPPGGIVVPSAFLHPDCFCDRDLNVIDVTPVQMGSKNSVGEAEGQDVLDGFLAQVVIDAINLLFVGDLQELFVSRPARCRDRARRAFDNNPRYWPLLCSISPAAPRLSTIGQRRRVRWAR